MRHILIYRDDKGFDVRISESIAGQYDYIHISDDRYELYIEGIILNDRELIKEYSKASFELFVYKQLVDNIEFVKELRGSFIGYLYSKETNSIKIFNDHIGTKNIYYTTIGRTIIVTSRYKDFYSYGLKINEDGAKMLLSYGYMLDDVTILSGVKKLNPGSILEISDDIKLKIKNYFRLSIEKIKIGQVEAIEELDRLFRRALKRQFDKDIQYGKQHLVSLSGGLDSRMTTWVAHEMGYTQQVNLTFSQSNYLDEKIAKKIAADLKHDWVFKFLDNGNFLFDLEEITDISGGNVLYYGLAHSNSILRLLNFERLGILHTGQLGDVIVGSFIRSLDTRYLQEVQGAYSKIGAQFLQRAKQYQSFEEKEIDLMYQRGFNGANSGLILINNYTETYSPFYDIDFMTFCLSVPIELRVNHYLYKSWILNKYPRAAQYIWEKTGNSLTQKSLTIKYKNKSIPVRKVYSLILSKLKGSKYLNKMSMNPLNYWYQTNEELRDFCDNYYKDIIDKVDNIHLKDICENLYHKGTATEKNQILTLLSVFKLMQSY